VYPSVVALRSASGWPEGPFSHPNKQTNASFSQKEPWTQQLRSSLLFLWPLAAATGTGTGRIRRNRPGRCGVVSPGLGRRLAGGGHRCDGSRRLRCGAAGGAIGGGGGGALERQPAKTTAPPPPPLPPPPQIEARARRRGWRWRLAWPPTAKG
jgi:hypothetical protein